MLLNIATDLLQEISINEKWRGDIFLVGDTLSDKGSAVNVLDHLHPRLCMDESFPKDSSFRFAGFRGIDSKESINKYVIERARLSGTVLTSTSGSLIENPNS